MGKDDFWWAIASFTNLWLVVVRLVRGLVPQPAASPLSIAWPGAWRRCWRWRLPWRMSGWGGSPGRATVAPPPPCTNISFANYVPKVIRNARAISWCSSPKQLPFVEVSECFPVRLANLSFSQLLLLTFIYYFLKKKNILAFLLTAWQTYEANMFALCRRVSRNQHILYVFLKWDFSHLWRHPVSRVHPISNDVITPLPRHESFCRCTCYRGSPSSFPAHRHFSRSLIRESLQRLLVLNIFSHGYLRIHNALIS